MDKELFKKAIKNMEKQIVELTEIVDRLKELIKTEGK